MRWFFHINEPIRSLLLIALMVLGLLTNALPDANGAITDRIDEAPEQGDVLEERQVDDGRLDVGDEGTGQVIPVVASARGCAQSSPTRSARVAVEGAGELADEVLGVQRRLPFARLAGARLTWSSTGGPAAAFMDRA